MSSQTGVTEAPKVPVTAMVWSSTVVGQLQCRFFHFVSLKIFDAVRCRSVSFLIFISITIITVQGWPEDRELRDSYRLSDMATATTPTMVNGTIWKVF